MIFVVRAQTVVIVLDAMIVVVNLRIMGFKIVLEMPFVKTVRGPNGNGEGGMKTKCIVCGADIEQTAHRKRRETCSPACRQKLYRDRKKASTANRNTDDANCNTDFLECPKCHHNAVVEKQLGDYKYFRCLECSGFWFSELGCSLYVEKTPELLISTWREDYNYQPK